MDQHRAAGIAAGIEESAPFGREVVIHANVGDDVAAFVVLALQAQPKHGADRRARAVGGQHIVGVKAVVSGWRCDIERGAVATGCDRCHLALPAHVDERAGRHRVVQIFLDVLLLQIVHRQVFFALGMRHLEAEDLCTAVVAAPKTPAERFCEEGPDRADPLKNVHARPRNADGAAAVIKGVLAVEQHGLDAVARQRQRRRHADGAGADDHDRMSCSLAVAFRRIADREDRVIEVEGFERAFAGGAHARPLFLAVEKTLHQPLRLA